MNRNYTAKPPDSGRITVSCECGCIVWFDERETFENVSLVGK